nr:hypothetical protein [Marseillevirus cajuinensis]
MQREKNFFKDILLAGSFSVLPPVLPAGSLVFLTTDLNLYLSDGTQWVMAAGDVGPLAAQVAQNTADIASLQTDVSGIQTDVATLQGQVATNTSDIGTLQSDVASLQAQVSTNTSDIATNTLDIATLQGQVSTNTSDISTLQGQVSTNTSDITTLQGQVATNTSNISTIQGDIVTINNALATLQAQQPRVVAIYYATTSITSDANPNITGFTTTTPSVYQFLAGQTSTSADLSLSSGQIWNMPTVGTAFNFRIDTIWAEAADGSENRIVRCAPLRGTDPSQVFISQTVPTGLTNDRIWCDIPIFVESETPGVGAYIATFNLAAPGASGTRTVTTRLIITQTKFV